MKTISISVGAVAVRTGGGEPPYYDVSVVVNGVRGTLSLEADGSPCAGADSLASWVSSSIRQSVEPAEIEEARATAAFVVRAFHEARR